MKNLYKLFGVIALAAVIGFTFVSCPADPGGGDPKPEPDVYVADVRQVSNWDYMVAGTDGSSMVFKVNESRGIPTALFLMPDKDSDIGFSFFFDENGLPDKMVAGGIVFCFDNFNGYQFDFTIIYPNGMVEYVLGIQTDVNWNAYNGASGGRSIGQGRSSIRDIKNVLEIVENVVGVGTCIGAAIPPLTVVLAVGCGAFVVDKLADVAIDAVFDDDMADGAGVVKDTVGCATGFLKPTGILDCGQALFGGADLFTVDDYDLIDRISDKIDNSRLKKREISGDFSITTTSLPNGRVGTIYTSGGFTAAGELTPTWSRISGTLPPGLFFSDAGLISGIPTTAGTYYFTVKATKTIDASHIRTTQKAFSITIAEKIAPTITAVLPDGWVGTPYNKTLTADGNTPITWNIAYETLPAGLSLSQTGVISGTPTEAGIFYVTVVATNTHGSDSKELDITIWPGTGGGGTGGGGTGGGSYEMVYVSGGSFQMGGDGRITLDGDGSLSIPKHTVTLTDFYLGKYEVTQAQWSTVMGSLPSNLTSNNYGKGDTFPIYSVSWYDVLVFCNKLSVMDGLTPAYRISNSTNPDDWGTVPTSNNATWDAVEVVSGSAGYRLPTEAQWEYAAKGGNGSPGNYTYAGSNTLGDVAWYTDNSGNTAHAVGTKSPNGLGIYDMSGNVSEWCWDWIGSYSDEAQTDPTGPASNISGNRVMRGGSYTGDYSTRLSRSACREYADPYRWFWDTGFRLARPYSSGGAHTHTYSATWSYDATQHWHDCIANDGAKTAVANHTGSPCTVCGYSGSSSGGGGTGGPTNWITVTNTALGGHSIDAIGYGNNRFVIGDSNGKMAYSSDGASWTAVTNSPFSTNGNWTISAIAYGSAGSAGNRFVAGANLGKMAYSDDGITWTAVADNTIWKYTYYNGQQIVTSSIKGIAYGSAGNAGGRFVAVGDMGKWAYSADGITWTALDSTIWKYTDNDTSPSHLNIRDIAYGGGKFVAVADSGKIAYSADGLSWTAVADSKFGEYTIETIAYGSAGNAGGRFVAGGNNGKMAYSDDGITWTAVAEFDTDGIQPIAYGSAGNAGNRFIAGSNTKVYSSSNGISWTAVADNPFGSQNDGYYPIQCFAYGNGRFVAGGGNGKIAYCNW